MHEQFKDANPFWRWMGFEIDESAAAQGRAAVDVAIRPEMLQHQGLLHGGVLSALIDSAGAWAFALSTEEPVRTINLAVQYLNPVLPQASRLTAHAVLIRAGGRIVLAEVAVCDQDGLEVARGQVIYSRARRS